MALILKKGAIVFCRNCYHERTYHLSSGCTYGPNDMDPRLNNKRKPNPTDPRICFCPGFQKGRVVL